MAQTMDVQLDKGLLRSDPGVAGRPLTPAGQRVQPTAVRKGGLSQWAKDPRRVN